MGLEVDDDQECPVAIRCRHTKSILNAVSKWMSEHRPQTPSYPSTHLEGLDVMIDQDMSKAKRRVPKLLRELESSLDIAPLKRRPKPSYHECYHIPLPDDEVEDLGTNCLIESSKWLFDKTDQREKDRTKIPRDSELPLIHIDSRRPTTVIICSRTSGSMTEKEQRKIQLERDAVEQKLRGGQIIPGLQGALYLHNHRGFRSMRSCPSPS